MVLKKRSRYNFLPIVIGTKITRTDIRLIFNDSKCTTGNAEEQSLIFPKGKLIENSNFTGNAYLSMMVYADSINKNSVGNVTFEPGARTNWHSHPNGQIILAIDGKGYYQEKGSPKKILQKGDVVKCPPNTPHWHGASEDCAFIQVSIGVLPTAKNKKFGYFLSPGSPKNLHFYV